MTRWLTPRKTGGWRGFLALGSLMGLCLVAAAQTVPGADPASKSSPVKWEDAYFKVIAEPDYKKIESGGIDYKATKVSDDVAVAQTIGLVNASPEACYKAAREYNRYTTTMPFTEESRIIQRFPLEGGPNAGADTVDFWTRVEVLTYETRYLIRIVHLEDRAADVFRTFWTLVNDPAKVVGCIDKQGRPCENDLASNLGSHRFEPYKGDPKRTLHTYTLKLEGRTWLQRQAIKYTGGTSMEEVTKRIRASAEGKN